MAKKWQSEAGPPGLPVEALERWLARLDAAHALLAQGLGAEALPLIEAVRDGLRGTVATANAGAAKVIDLDLERERRGR